MLQIQVQNVVHAIVEQELRGKGREDSALYIHLDLRMSHHTDDKSYDQSRGLHMLYYCLPHMNYISVFSSVTDSPFTGLRDVKEWKHECSHDSCWRDVNTYSQVYFKMAEDINSEIKQDWEKKHPGRIAPQVAPKDMHEWHSFGRSGLYMWVPVKVRKDPKDTNNYRKLVEVVW